MARYMHSRSVSFFVLVQQLLHVFQHNSTTVGVWLSPYEAERRHDVRFDTEFVSRGCRNEYIVSHKQSIENMRKTEAQDVEDNWSAL